MTGLSVPTLGAVVAARAGTQPDAVALRFEDRSWTYRELDRHGNRIARSLLRDGLRPGDRIGFLGRNNDAVPLLALGVTRAGMIFVPINWRLSHREVTHILADCGCRLLFRSDEFRDAATEIATLPAAAAVGEGDWLAADEATVAAKVVPEDTALLIYTSGTTGLPKGVMLSHRSLFGTSVMRASASVPWDDWGADDVTLVPIPLAHIAGFGMLVRTLFFGGQVIVQPTFEPGQVLHAIQHQRVSKIGLVPTAIKMVLGHPRSGDVDYSRIKTMIYGAAPISLDLLREAIAVFGCQFAQSYGMSETSGTCVVLPPDDHDVAGNARMRAAGVPLPGTEIRIVSEDGGTLPPESVGEIAVRSVSMMNGYWNMPEATARVLDADGWYRTGDAGYVDEDGYLFIKDRVKDMIVSGAENIYPAEVENVLADHPSVSEVAVIGVPDALWGEAVKAVVVPRPGEAPDEKAIIVWAKERIADYKAPKSIDFVAALPHNATGKVQKVELRKLYWGATDRGVN